MEGIRGEAFCCILCGTPSSQEGMSLKAILALDKFRQQLNRFSSVTSGGLLFGGIPAFCEECLCDVTQTTENGEEVVRVEGEVRRLQQELLRQMHQLCTLLDTYLKGMGRIEGKVQKDNKTSFIAEGGGWKSGNAVQFRSVIVKVVQELGSYRTNLAPKLLIPPQSPSLPPCTDRHGTIPSPTFQAVAEPVAEDEEFLETDYFKTQEAPPIGNNGPLSSESDYWKSPLQNTAESGQEDKISRVPAQDTQTEESDVAEHSDKRVWDDEEDDDPDYIKSEPESSSEYSPSSPAESDADLSSYKTKKPVERETPSSPPASPSTSSLAKEVVVPNRQEVSQSENPVQRQKKNPVVTCEHCGKSLIKSYLRTHLVMVHGIRSEEKPVEERPNFKFPCAVCGERISDVFCYKQHLALHSNKKEETVLSSTIVTLNSKEITLRKEKFVPDMASLFQIKDLAERKEERKKQYVIWYRKKKVPCPLCRKLVTRWGMRYHLTVVHELAVIIEGDHKEDDSDDNTPHTIDVASSSSEITLKQEKFVPNSDELSKIEDPFARRMALVKQRNQWRAQKVRCPVCGVKCCRSNMRNHMTAKHQDLIVEVEGSGKKRTRKPALEKEEKYVKKICPECGMKMSSNSTLQYHLLKKHNISNPCLIAPSGQGIVACDLCHSKMDKAQLVEHLKEHVGGEYVIRCPNPTCAYASITFKSIRIHLQATIKCREKVQDYESFTRDFYTCKECGEVRGNQGGLRAHLLQFHETVDQPFVCPISGCEQRFTCRQSVVLHLPWHNLPPPPSMKTQCCSECKEQVNLEGMAVHLKEKHGILEIIRCTHCPFQFGLREHLVKHLFKHRHSQTLSCDICGMEKVGVFNGHGTLAEHYFKEHQIGTRWNCEQCEKSYLREESLKYHIILKHKETSAPERKETFQCESCGKKLLKKESLRSHQMRFHGATPYGCNLCQATFEKLKALRDHKKEVHMGVPLQKEFPCPEPGCGVILKSSRALKNHNSVIHLREPASHVCEQCGKAYRTVTALRNHRDIIHLKLRNHVCMECGEAFGHQTVLQNHMLIHTGERPFACEICGQRFRTRDVLKTHLKGHERKGGDFKPNGPMKQIRKRVAKK